MSGQGGLASFLPLILLFVAAWFLLIRPQQKRAREQSEMLSRLKAGDEVMTAGGIYATVVSVGEERVRIAIADGSELEVARQAVRDILSSALDESDDDEPDADEDDTESEESGTDVEAEGDK